MYSHVVLAVSPVRQPEYGCLTPDRPQEGVQVRRRYPLVLLFHGSDIALLVGFSGYIRIRTGNNLVGTSFLHTRHLMINESDRCHGCVL